MIDVLGTWFMKERLNGPHHLLSSPPPQPSRLGGWVREQRLLKFVLCSFLVIYFGRLSPWSCTSLFLCLQRPLRLIKSTGAWSVAHEKFEAVYLSGAGTSNGPFSKGQQVRSQGLCNLSSHKSMMEYGNFMHFSFLMIYIVSACRDHVGACT